MSILSLSSKLIYLVVLLLSTTVSVHAHPNIDRNTATNPEVVLEIEPTAYPLGKALGASSHIHPTERLEGTVAVASSKLVNATLTPPFAGGDGTSGNPYQIATAEQLNEVRNYLDKHFILIAEINLDVAPYNTGEGWEPLGNSTTKFTGNVNGNGYTIDGLFIDRPTNNYVGLFGYTEGATIESVGLTNVDILGNAYVGGLVGYNYNSSTITDSYATGSVEGKVAVGGFLGYYSSGSLTHNYWDTQSSGKTKGIGNCKRLGVTGKTSAQMTKQATFEGWDFSTVWAITENTTYPWLQKNAQEQPPKPSFDACCPMAKENTQVPDQPSSTEEEDTPKRLEVLQNYPNPFNPTTNIRFSLPEAGQVRLTVYTMMGQRVKQLANKPYQAGTHVVSFEAGNLASGMYVYQLWVNGKWVGTHTMTLIK